MRIDPNTLSLDIHSLKQAYAGGDLTPSILVEELLRRTSDDPNRVWIQRLSDADIRAYAQELEQRDPATLPLYGIPFAIKDNIDLAGVVTTAGCPAFAYTPDQHAFVVKLLIDAGAIPLGKTNLDQFATGLNGTRSPWGACRNAFSPDMIAGGSSSGSAVAVAKGYVSFALGTDTAGSGRVPAAFNNIVGHKPSLGWLSSRGLVPACRSLDTLSVFALCAADAETVLSVAAVYDEQDPFARRPEGHGFDFGTSPTLRIGIARPDQLRFFGNPDSEACYQAALKHAAAIGAELVEIDLQPFLDTAELLYAGPWVAERHAAIRDFFDAQPGALLPVISQIIGGACKWSATDAYAYSYRLKDAQLKCNRVWREVDCILTPTAGTIYSIVDMEADPIALNSALGYYTNFMNLLDYAATAVPAGLQVDGLPFGITLFAPAHQDGPLLHLASRWQQALGGTAGATGLPLPSSPAQPLLPNGQIRVAVCGAHLAGLPLNGQLSSRGARLIAEARTAPEYAFYALAGGPPARPGMVHVAQGGTSISLEIWEMPVREFGSFVAGIPAPLGIGVVKLEDGSSVQGFVCEASATVGAEDISPYGGWRAYLAR
jgi:allophanate hydrolase